MLSSHFEETSTSTFGLTITILMISIGGFFVNQKEENNSYLKSVVQRASTKLTWEYVLMSVILSSILNKFDDRPMMEWPPSSRTIIVCLLGHALMLYSIFKRESEDKMKDKFMKETRCENIKKKLAQTVCGCIECDHFKTHNVRPPPMYDNFKHTRTAKKRKDQKRERSKSETYIDVFTIYYSIYDKTNESFVDVILSSCGEYDDVTKAQFETLRVLFEKVLESDLENAVSYTRQARDISSPRFRWKGSLESLEDALTIESYRGDSKLRKLLCLIVGSDTPVSTLYSFVSISSDKTRMCVAKTMPSVVKKSRVVQLLQEGFEEVRISQESKTKGMLRFWQCVRPEVPSYCFGMGILAIAWIGGPLVWHSIVHVFDDVYENKKTLDQVWDTLCGTILASIFTWLFDQSGWFLIERAQSRLQDRLKNVLMSHALGLDQDRKSVV